MTNVASKKDLPYIIIGIILNGLLAYAIYYTLIGFSLLSKTELSSLLTIPSTVLLLITYGFVKNLFIIFFLAYLDYLFFKKKKLFIKMGTSFLIIKFIFDIIDTLTQNFLVLMAPDLEDLLISIVRAALFTSLFIKYLQLSKKMPLIFAN